MQFSQFSPSGSTEVCILATFALYKGNNYGQISGWLSSIHKNVSNSVKLHQLIEMKLNIQNQYSTSTPAHLFAVRGKRDFFEFIYFFISFKFLGFFFQKFSGNEFERITIIKLRIFRKKV